MPLDEYQRKRDFRVTPEPAGEAAAPSPAAGALAFVVHKHAARALHYDVRLEMGGVYASWAVPKGPSLDPAEKRLAVHVEDHPLAYGTFEGTIPAGEYGAGTVMVWDRGVFSPIGEPLAALAAGQLKFVLEGQKLHGGFALVRMKPRPGEKRENWLLIKERDAQARPHAEYDVLTELPDSAASGRTMDHIAETGTVWTAGGVEGAPPSSPPEPTVGPAGADGSAGKRPGAPADGSGPGGGAQPGPLPLTAPFQLATLADEAPEGDTWVHEIKYDGYRVRIAVERGRARVLTRNGGDWTDRFAPMARAAESLPATSALLDGEAVVFGPDGRSDFALLQEALSSKRPDRIEYAAFDLLHLDGFDLRAEPLLRRKELLRALLATAPADAPLRYVEHFAGRGPAYHASSCELLLEGSVSKRGDRPWVPGRSRDWLKAKCLLRQEFVIGGWTDPSGTRAGFGALLLGVHGGDGKLRYAGRVGTGFTDATLADLRSRLDAAAAAQPSFADPPELKGTHWVRPELVAEVSFREWTRAGHVRQPSFQGLREDADPASVTRESASSASGPEALPGDTTREDPGLRVAGIAISNPGKVLAPAGVSKGALARYYEAVASAMLPHLAGRLLTIVRCPHGQGAEAACFYQKHPEGRGWPASLGVVQVREKGGMLPYFFVDDEPGLIALAQLGSLEVHTWSSLASDPEVPDRIVFDLDPGEGLAFEAVATAAVTVRDALASLGLVAFAKTTGGRGLHVVTPIVAEHGFDTVRAAARALVDRLAAAEPSAFTAKMAKAARRGRIFVDYLRNAHGATAVCAFSTRARPGAPVSMPVAWSGLAGIDPAAFDVESVPGLLAGTYADPWAAYEEARRPLAPETLEALGVSSG